MFYLQNIFNSGQSTVAPQWAALAFGAITGTSIATGNLIITTTADRLLLIAENTTDKDIILTVGGTTGQDIKPFRAGTSQIIDLGADYKKIFTGTELRVYQRSGAPTSGEFLLTVI